MNRSAIDWEKHAKRLAAALDAQETLAHCLKFDCPISDELSARLAATSSALADFGRDVEDDEGRNHE